MTDLNDLKNDLREYINNPIKKETSESPDEIEWVTVFYRGADPANIEEFAKGPEHMKDIRLIELPDNKIGVFTRPKSIQTRFEDVGYTEVVCNTLGKTNRKCFWGRQ